VRLGAAAVLALAGAAAVPAHGAPVVDQMVVFRSGDVKARTVGTDATRVSAGGRRCRVPRATPLAALVRSRVAALRLTDFSRSCDPSSLFVRAIGGDRNRGAKGWVYKVGNRQGTTAASDPSGPFGAGRLRRRVRITWFYCVFAQGGCQRTLGLRARDEGGGSVSVRVTGFDDEGGGIPVPGARVVTGAVSATTDSSGRATLTLPPGSHTLHAQKRGAVRSFGERLDVR
jgi:hypothetical protein